MLGNKTAVLIDEFDFTGSFFAAETEHTVAEKDNTVFGADAMTFEPGLASDKLMLRGYYSGNAAGAVFKELRARLGAAGVNTPMAVLIDTTDANCVAECSANGWGQALKVNLAAPELITFELNTPPAGSAVTGLRILDTTVSATGNQTAVDFGAAGAAGGMVFVFVQAITGTATNASVKVQSSTSSGGTYADEATVTFSAEGGYVAVMTGAINRWLRVNVAGMGGATAIKLVAIACVKGVTY
jgi:hypothetical protein